MVVGGLSGAGFGVLSGKIADYGINEDFIKNLGKTIPQGSSALFVLVRSSMPDKVRPEIEPYKPHVRRTSRSKQQEDKPHCRRERRLRRRTLSRADVCTARARR